MALFKFFYAAFNKPFAAFSIFLLPSILFWTGVIYKDGLLYMSIGFFLYFLFVSRKSLLAKGFLIFLFLTIIIVSRANTLITLLPAVFFLLLAKKTSRKISLAITLATILIAAIILNAILPGGVLNGLSDRQKEFQLMEGGSKMYLPMLEPTATSFFSVFPTAFINGFFQPLPGSGGKWIYTAFFAELIIMWAIILYACILLFRKKQYSPAILK